jgi:hypothetical protein
MEADAQQILRTSTINSSALCKGPGGLTPDLLTLSLHAVLLEVINHQNGVITSGT